MAQRIAGTAPAAERYIIQDGRDWYTLADGDEAVKDGADEVEILLRGGGEARKQASSAWFMQRNVKVYLEALAAPHDRASPAVTVR